MTYYSIDLEYCQAPEPRFERGFQDSESCFLPVRNDSGIAQGVGIGPTCTWFKAKLRYQQRTPECVGKEGIEPTAKCL